MIMKTEIITERYLNENGDTYIEVREYLPDEYLEKLKKEKGEIIQPFFEFINEKGEIVKSILNGCYTERIINKKGEIIDKNYCNGELVDIDIYTEKNGYVDGVLKTFYSNGNIMKKEFYKNGEKNGYSKWYYEFGGMFSSEIYENGKLVETII